MADTLCTKCRNPECEYAGRKAWVMICAHEYVAPPMTHGDKLRDKNDEELAQWIAGIYPDCPPGFSPAPLGCDDVCAECWLEWLKEEVEPC